MWVCSWSLLDPPCSKASHQPVAGLLQPLPIHRRLWSHVVLDFITGVHPEVTQPLSHPWTDPPRLHILLCCPRFPTALETAERVMVHLHGNSLDITSDWGPLLIFDVWRGFCRGPCASVILTSGFHHQYTGQSGQSGQPGVGNFFMLCV